MNRFFIVLCLIWPAFTRGAEPPKIADVIRAADEITLFSIYPQQIHEVDEHGNPSEADRKKERFHGHPIFGKIHALDDSTKKTIRDALLAALGSVSDGAPAMCFMPRHAACLKRGAEHVDLLICFECGNAEWRYREVLVDGERVERKQMFSLGSAGHEALNRLLDVKGIERDLPKGRTRR